MREVPKSGPLVLKGGSDDPPDPPPGYGPESKHQNKITQLQTHQGTIINFYIII